MKRYLLTLDSYACSVHNTYYTQEFEHVSSAKRKVNALLASKRITMDSRVKDIPVKIYIIFISELNEKGEYVKIQQKSGEEENWVPSTYKDVMPRSGTVCGEPILRIDCIPIYKKED